MTTGGPLDRQAVFPSPIQANANAGIFVSDYYDKQYDLSEKNNAIFVTQTVEKEPKRMRVCFSFQLDKPTRFRVDVYVPATCQNARIALNNQELIGYFSDVLPDRPYPVTKSACQTSHAPYSTLKPGAFQSINFRWQTGDHLSFHFYF